MPIPQALNSEQKKPKQMTRTMEVSITDTSFLLVMLSLLSHQKLSNANDTINTTQSLRENQTLLSSGGSFELGFFTPGNSNNWYVGIWYRNITPKTVVWVANREIPLKNSLSGVLTVIEPGCLVILNETNNIIWSTNNSGVVQNPVAQLLDSGNIVLRDENDEQPENYLSSWKNEEDPAPGGFTCHLDPAGYPQVVTRKGAVFQNRIGPWNGLVFSGTPIVRKDPAFKFELQMNKSGVYYSGEALDNSTISRFTLNPNGVLQRTTWVDQSQDWAPYLNIPADNCDTYRLCGAYGSCNIGDFPVCGCLDKFVPKDPQGWTRADWSNGCVRRTELNCTVGDGFRKYSGIKLPDARSSRYNESMTLWECKEECLKNCSCMAYTNLNISQGGSGCLLWYGELVDIRVLSAGGQDLYIRMASSESDASGTNGKKKVKLILSLTIVGTILLVVSLLP